MLLRTWSVLLGFFLLLAVASPGQDARFIRLRNETVATPPPPVLKERQDLAKRDTSTVSGLHVIQLDGVPDEAARAALAAEGVDLLSPVPENAFVCHLESAKSSAIRALPFVRWLGEFRPAWRLDARLARRMTAEPSARFGIKAVLRAGAPAGELVFAIRQFSGDVHRTTTKFGTFISGTADARRILALARSGTALWIEPASRMKLVDEIATKIVLGDEPPPGERAAVQQLGFDGRGVTVAVADSGLDSGDASTMHPDLRGRVDGFFAYGGLEDASDEHSHGTHCAGIVAGNATLGTTDEEGHLWGLGVAPGAHIVAQRIFDGAGDYFPPASFETMTRDAVRSGAYVGSNSWGDDTQGRYDLSAAEFDALVRDADALTPGEQPYVLEFSAGNSGPGEQTIGSPAVAKNVIATGACQNDRFNLALYSEGREAMADFSSRGPAEDGRIKPDITAPGTWIASLKSQFASDANAWLPIDENYLYQGGTSQAGPHVSGACAVFVQWYRDTQGGSTPSPALVKASLINSAVDMATTEIPIDPQDPEGGSQVVGDTGPVPNGDEGWGRVDLVGLVTGERRYEFTEQDSGLRTAGVFEKRVIVGADDPLKVTLAYTDVPGLPAAIPALVNDLDLEAVSPDGHVYRGNAFLDGETVPDTAEGDRINNVEGLFISNPAAGEWILRVRGVRVVQDVHARSGVAPEQDFALVVSGQIPMPGEGVVSWDRQTYRAPFTAGVRLVDTDLRNQPTATVQVTSTSQTQPLVLTLQRSGAGGSFTGAVQLVRSPVAGSLLVANADEVTLSYTDASPAGTRSRTATVDLSPPVVDQVRAVGRFGRTSIRMVASEPVSVVAYVSLTNGPVLAVTNLSLRTSPEVFLPELTPDAVYRYFVVATDGAGNVTTNDNGGRFYFFTGSRPAKALLLYSPENTFEQLGLGFPGIDNWTAPLDALGIDYEVWNFAETNIVPTAAILSGYRVVLWRPEELGALPSGLAASLTTYVQGGGALFAASSEVLSRLSASEQAFRTNVLHVADFTEDGGASIATGVRGDPVTSGMNLGLNYDEFPDFGSLLDFSTFPDHLRIAGDAAPILNQDEGKVVGMRYPRTGSDSRGRVVFLSIPFEAVPTDTDAPDNRVTLLGRSLDFLVPGLRGGATLALDQPAYTLPAAVVVEVNDAARAGRTNLTVHVSDGSDPAGLDIRLSESPLRGLFRARLTLVASQTVAAGAQLRAANGDTVTVVYSGDTGGALSTEALVDTVRPVVGGVAWDPAYNEAVITWTTDKPTDGLVRFGEGGRDDSFLSRSAYNAELSTSHSVQIAGLQPDRDYVFLVSGRDQAGNVGIANNAGQLFVLRTLRPLDAPWNDTLENGRTGWATFDDNAFDEETGASLLNTTWNFGRPVNRYGITALSGTNCWATNLGGDSVDTAIADLISPAVDLRGGNQATLRFHTWYDTTERSDLLDIEVCQVAISTNNGALWSDLVGFGYGDVSDGWEEVRVDISRFAGQVVRLRFNYQLLSFESTDRPGWFVDDLSITVTNRSASDLQITNNIAQAAFSVRGPAAFGTVFGSGRTFNVTNATSGTYVVQWAAIDDWIAPASVTNTLGTNRLVVSGVYTFPDANGNGISDLWEARIFGGILTTNAAPETDSDGDGFGNLSEFLAGTDPLNRKSSLRLNPPSGGVNGPIAVSWPTTPNREYRLELSNDLTTWSAGGLPVRGTGLEVTNTIPALLGRGQYYFRVRVSP
jgi:Subtilase family/Immune inhibitor A peptidase M6